VLGKRILGKPTLEIQDAHAQYTVNAFFLSLSRVLRVIMYYMEQNTLSDSFQ